MDMYVSKWDPAATQLAGLLNARSWCFEVIDLEPCVFQFCIYIELRVYMCRSPGYSNVGGGGR